MPIILGMPHNAANGRRGTLFVQTAAGEWTNLTRASALKIDRHANPNKKGWVVLAFYPGRVHTLATLESELAANDWLNDLLEFAGLVPTYMGDDD
jgi:hypothetical protein